MYTFVLYSVDLDETKTIDSENYVAPQGWDDLQYAIPRNETYDGFILEFTAQLGFTGEIKTWLRTIIDTYGLSSEIQATIKKYNTGTFSNDTIFTGSSNLADYREDDEFLTINLQSTAFERNIKNRESEEIEYNSRYSLDGTGLPGYLNEFEDIVLYGNAGSYDDDEGNTITISETTTIKAVYPFELFNKYFQKLTNVDYPVLRSSILGRTDLTANGFSENYGVNGDLSMIMVTIGKAIRGWDYNGINTPKIIDKIDLVLNFKTLFETFNKITPLGMGVEKVTQADGTIRKYIIIEEKDYFYQNAQYSFTKEIGELSDLERIVASEYHYNRIKAGGQTFSTSERFGAGEFNTEVNYSLPTDIFSNELNLTKTYRIDGSGIEELRWSPKADTQDKNINGDNDVFLIDCYDDGTDIRTKDDSTAAGFQAVSGITGDTLPINIRLRGTQSIYNWGKWINVGLQFNSSDYLRFQKTKSISKIVSQLTGTSQVVTDNEDIAISDLIGPILTGFLFKFASPLEPFEILEIQSNPYYFLKFWNYIDNKYSYIWLKEVSTNPIDGETNWIGYETIDINDLPGGFILQENADYILQENADKFLQEAS